MYTNYDKFKEELPYSGRWFYFESKENLLRGINNLEKC